MRRIALLATIAAVLGIAVGCGQDDETPVACLDGAGAYLGALADAPGEVKLSGEVPISDCLAENQTGGDLATVGSTMVEVTTELNHEAREDPGGEANLRLGYLIGAAVKGAEETSGIHAELIRRLEAAASYGPGERALPKDFRVAYEEGFEAGRKDG